jgi:hypothetical protein
MVVCDGDQTITCDDTGQWGAAADCAYGVCTLDNGTSVCEAQCLPGDHDCTSDGATAESVCTDQGVWDVPTACPGGTTCRTDAHGVDLGCVQCVGSSSGGNTQYHAADAQCTDATTLQNCGANNQWAAEAACPGTDVCNQPDITTNGGLIAWCQPAP